MVAQSSGANWLTPEAVVLSGKGAGATRQKSSSPRMPLAMPARAAGIEKDGGVGEGGRGQPPEIIQPANAAGDAGESGGNRDSRGVGEVRLLDRLLDRLLGQ